MWCKKCYPIHWYDSLADSMLPEIRNEFRQNPTAVTDEMLADLKNVMEFGFK